MSRPTRSAGRRSSRRSSDLRRAPSGEPSSRLSISFIRDDRELVRNRRSSRRQSGMRASRSTSATVTPEGQVRWLKSSGEVLRRTERAGDPDDRRRPGHHRRRSRQTSASATRRSATARSSSSCRSPATSSTSNEESATYISPQIADLVGYTAEEWMADPSFFANVLHPDDRDRVLRGFADDARDRRAVRVRIPPDRARRARRLDPRRCRRRPRRGRQPLYAQGYMIDISERKRTESALLAEPGAASRAHGASRAPGAPRRLDRPARTARSSTTGSSRRCAQRGETGPDSR